jgi:hypothetical protein
MGNTQLYTGPANIKASGMPSFILLANTGGWVFAGCGIGNGWCGSAPTRNNIKRGMPLNDAVGR